MPENFEGYIYTFKLFDRATLISLPIIVLLELSQNFVLECLAYWKTYNNCFSIDKFIFENQLCTTSCMLNSKVYAGLIKQTLQTYSHSAVLSCKT